MSEAAGNSNHGLRNHWDTVYASKTPSQVSWYQPIPDLSLSMIRASEISLSAPIIDVGGGASSLADHLLSNGYRSITVLDIAENAMEQSRQRLGPAAELITWIATEITSWRPSTRYALWHDRAVFHFMTNPTERRAYISTLLSALQPGGTVILATFAMDGPERCSGLPVQRYSAKSLIAEFGPEFSLLQTENEEHITPSGSIQKFLYCRLLHRRAGISCTA